MQFAHSLRIVIPGGTGRLGSLLARHFHDQGHAVSTITRFPKPGPGEAIHWDAENVGYWATALENADVVLNLTACCVPVVRAKVSALLALAISQCACPPRLWMNASGLEIDANALSYPTPATRKIHLRLAPVMSPDFGSFPWFLRLVRWGLGGEIGGGEQHVSWVHDFDFIRAVEFLIACEDATGAVDITSPFPLPNHEFMARLRDAWCTSYFGLPIPAWLAPRKLLESVNVTPTVLMEAGFRFHFPEWRGASENLVQRWRQIHEA